MLSCLWIEQSPHIALETRGNNASTWIDANVVSSHIPQRPSSECLAPIFGSQISWRIQYERVSAYSFNWNNGHWYSSCDPQRIDSFLRIQKQLHEQSQYKHYDLLLLMKIKLSMQSHHIWLPVFLLFGSEINVLLMGSIEEVNESGIKMTCCCYIHSSLDRHVVSQRCQWEGIQLPLSVCALHKMHRHRKMCINKANLIWRNNEWMTDHPSLTQNTPGTFFQFSAFRFLQAKWFPPSALWCLVPRASVTG